ncbi:VITELLOGENIN-LIKE PROTEIN [Salix purpurea]|uniref:VITELLOGENIN-LIKE PROTEIN n=1 Tax=Salix purpurea TaxID=77065 RepID=A0A9Q0Z399_SALPP|nr:VITELLOGENIN-LIKE PROTEIN [Salix purpurea]
MDMKGGVGVGGGRVGVGEEDLGDGMQCSDHPYRNNPGGICAFCLQEKLGKLVSSSFPLPIRGSSSSSSSPSFRSDIGAGGSSNGGAGTSLSLAVRPTTTKCRNDGGSHSHYQEYYTRRARIPFLLAKKKKKIMVASSDRDIVFKRSKSTTTPRRSHFLDAATDDGEDFSPRRRGETTAATTNRSTVRPKEKCLGSSLSRKGDNIVVVEDEDDSPNSQASASASTFERKVSRSRSVGCGSRSFSGDFFERISTGFGDCTLRRVESQREGKPKVSSGTSHMKERVRCGGIFGGFIITSSSSSSSSSSYWVSSSAEDMNGKSSGAGHLAHGRSRSWGWAFASPMRAFGSKPSSKDGKRNIKHTTPNLSAIPSLLAVRG